MSKAKKSNITSIATTLGLSFVLSTAISVTVLAEVSSTKASKKEAAKPVEKVKKIELDPAASTVEWEGKKVTGQHNGTLKVKSGVIEVNGETIVGGKVEVDMQSLANSDIKSPEDNQKLVGHLKSDDFFSVAKHPVATFVIKSAKSVTGKADQTHVLIGDMNIKGKSQSVEVPVQVTQKDGHWTGVAKVNLDRTKWNIRYGSGKFFSQLGDKVINDEFTLNLKLVSK